MPGPGPTPTAAAATPGPGDLLRAARAIEPWIVRTPVVEAPGLSRILGGPVLLKLENLQVTGSFKVRGAANRMLALDAVERERGVVACSSGNHGRAVAHVAHSLGIPAVLCVPDWVDPVKLEAMRASGADVRLAGGSYDEAEAEAVRIQSATGAVFVHPFDDPWIVAGQGTIGLEILEDAPGVGNVVVPVSGGGLAGGIALALRSRDPSVRVTGVSARAARVMVESIRAGRPVSLPEDPTLATALSGGIGLENRLTLALVRDLVDAHVLVGEDEIASAMLHAFEELHLVVEGGGAVGLAALLSGALSATEGSTVLVMSGGNVGLERLSRLRAGRR